MEILAAFYKFAIINKNLSERFSSECQKESAFALVLLYYAFWLGTFSTNEK